jgi:hypothetical protein
VLHPFYKKKGDFEINAKKILKDFFCNSFCMFGWASGWTMGENFFFFCILHN